MSQLSAIKDRIRTITNLHKVTSAMEMVTRTKIHKMRQNALNAADYQERFARLYAAVSGRFAAVPEDARRPPQKYYLAFFARQGFCGGFNDKLLSCLRAAVLADAVPARLYLLGRAQAKWKQALAREFQHIEAAEKNYQAQTAPLIAEMKNKILDGEKIEIYFVYNQPVSVLEQKPLARKIYPLAPAAAPADVLLEPDAGALYPAILNGYLAAWLERVYWASAAGEYYARLLSMKNANDNAELILSSLALEYNKTRQIRITQELSEVISAFDVLKMSAEKKEREGV